LNMVCKENSFIARCCCAHGVCGLQSRCSFSRFFPAKDGFLRQLLSYYLASTAP
jgi:hypothetical protein